MTKYKTNIRKENVTEIEVNGEPYYIWESLNGFKGSKENPNQFITDARAVLDFSRSHGFETLQDVINYINTYFVKSAKKSKMKKSQVTDLEQCWDLLNFIGRTSAGDVLNQNIQKYGVHDIDDFCDRISETIDDVWYSAYTNKSKMKKGQGIKKWTSNASIMQMFPVICDNFTKDQIIEDIHRFYNENYGDGDEFISEWMQDAIAQWNLPDPLEEGYSASAKKSEMKKTPIVNLYGNDDEETREEIEFYDSGADVTAQEIEALAPSADVIVDMGHVDVIWNLPSGNHPGLWITTHGKGRQGVHVTARMFDYPDEENVGGFLDYIHDKYGRKSYELENAGSGLPPEEIKEAIAEMERELGRYAMESKLPRYSASAKKSKKPSISTMSFEDNVNKLRKSNYAKSGNLNTVMKERK